MKKYTKPTIETFEVRASESIADMPPGYDGWESAGVTRYDLMRNGIDS